MVFAFTLPVKEETVMNIEPDKEASLPQEHRISDELTVDRLPDELKLYITQHLDPKSLAMLGSANRDWRRIVQDPSIVTYSKMKNDFPEIFSRVVDLMKAETTPKKSIKSKILGIFRSSFGKSKSDTLDVFLVIV